MVAFAFNDGGNFPANQRYPIGMLAQLTVRAIQQGGQRIDRAVDRQFAPQFRANVIVPGRRQAACFAGYPQDSCNRRSVHAQDRYG